MVSGKTALLRMARPLNIEAWPFHGIRSLSFSSFVSGVCRNFSQCRPVALRTRRLPFLRTHASRLLWDTGLHEVVRNLPAIFLTESHWLVVSAKRHIGSGLWDAGEKKHLSSLSWLIWSFFRWLQICFKKFRTVDPPLASNHIEICRQS